MFFKPKEGPCFICGEGTLFPCNWKNNWFVCDECLDAWVLLLRRKKPAGLAGKCKKMELTSLWQPFKKMDNSVMVALDKLQRESVELEETFNATKLCCNEFFELDEEKGLFRVTMEDGYYSPILPLSSIKDYYVQDVYQEYDSLTGMGNVDPSVRYRHGWDSPNHICYDHSVISLELDNPYVTFLDFEFLSEEEQPMAMLTEGKEIRAKADAELSEVLGKKTSDTRVLVMPAMSSLMEFNPYSKSMYD